MVRDWHDFLNVARQTVDVRKAHKMVMKIKYVYTTYKTHIKNFHMFDHEKNFGLKTLLNFCLIVYIAYRSD